MISVELQARAEAILVCGAHRPVAVLELPFVIMSAANARDSHWGRRSERVGKQRSGVNLAFKSVARRLLAAESLEQRPVVVRLVRCATRRLDDDNLGGALKAIRDGIADSLGVNDRNPVVRFVTDQEHSPKPHVVVEVYRP